MSKEVAVVTGASRGIGRSIADNLKALNMDVVYVDLSFKEPLETSFICDITSARDREALLDFTLSKYNRVDLLVNNAGIAPAKRMDILETTQESFRRVMEVNLEGSFFMCQLFANHMIKQNHTSRIINISSISAYTSSVLRGEYCISKAGISMVTKLFADRLAEHGIGVFEIRPGIIMTDMTAQVKDKYEKLISEGLTPIKRMGIPQDVANVAVGIAQGNFDFCTGQVFDCDGGFHIRRL